MSQFHVRFIINQLTDEELGALRNDQAIITKMILTPDDYKLFHYRQGDSIEVQTHQGYRLWCSIEHIEIIPSEDRIILIFTLLRENSLHN